MTETAPGMPNTSSALRLLVVAIDPDLREAAVQAAARAGLPLADLVVDAVSATAARLDAGMPAPGAPPPGPRAVMLEERVPGWVLDQVDSLVGRGSDWVDRGSVLRASLAQHFGGASARAAASPPPARASRPAPAPAAAEFAHADMVTFGGTSGPGAATHLSATGSGRMVHVRHHSRLLRLIESRAVQGGGLDIDDLLSPSDLLGARPLDPERVLVGLPDELRRQLGGVRFPSVAPARPADEMNMFGLTNRIAPTLWGARCLIEMQVASAGNAVPYGAFLKGVIPEAWRTGAGLEVWEAENRLRSASGAVRFSVSARWPSTPDPSASEKAMRREASTIYGFIEYALCMWSAPSRARPNFGIPRGPLIALGLVVAEADEAGAVALRATEQAVDLLTALDPLDVSCAYPHQPAAWAAYRTMLLRTNPVELHNMRGVLREIVAAKDRKALADAAVKVDKSVADLTNGSATFVNGYVARLREWGLLDLARLKTGAGALTREGIAELNRDDVPAHDA